MRKIALIDLDGTLADYDRAMIRDLAALASPGERSEAFYRDEDDEPTHLRNRRHMIKNQPGWWLGLEPIMGGFRVADLLVKHGFALNVLSAGPRAIPDAWSQKLQWCAKHLPGVNVTLTRDKSIAYGRVLVDDFPKYIEPWLLHRPRALVLMPDRGWNEKFTHPQVIRYHDFDARLDGDLQKIDAALRAMPWEDAA